MKIVRLAITALLIGVAANAIAATSSPAPAVTQVVKKPAASKPISIPKLKQLVETRLGDGVKVETVSKTDFSGLYEVRTSSGEILYTDAQAKYLISGHIIDLQTHKDYTRERLDEVNKITFADLPFDSAIKMVKGDGKRVIAVFEDPNCGYCKHLRQTLATMDNVTVYTFMYNILAPDSFVKSKNVWCTSDRVKAWDDWMLNGKAPVDAPATCITTPNDKVLALGKRMRINGTPTIIFTDGTRSPGALDASALEEKWAALQ